MHCYNADTSRKYTLRGGLQKRREIDHLQRPINSGHGLRAEDDEPSDRYFEPPQDGAALGTDPRAAWPTMKRNYYRHMGWDEETGKPLPETLRELDLEWLAKDFWPEEAAVGAR